jgi:hypothetical protein
MTGWHVSINILCLQWTTVDENYTIAQEPVINRFSGSLLGWVASKLACRSRVRILVSNKWREVAQTYIFICSVFRIYVCEAIRLLCPERKTAKTPLHWNPYLKLYGYCIETLQQYNFLTIGSKCLLICFV